MKAIGKRILWGILVVLLALPVSLGQTGIAAWDTCMITTVYADSSTVRLSKTLSSCKIAEINRPASEGLWTMRVGGRKVFCLNPGKALHNQDTAKRKKVSAVNYENQALAKVLTYYFGVNGQKGGTKTYALCQAYAWAAGAGKNKKTAMLQAASACGAGSSYAREVYQAIDATAPYGKVIYYTVNHCKKGGNGSAHQHLIGWESEKAVQAAEYDTVSDALSGEDTETIRIRVEKKDAVTGSLLDTARFAIYRDGVQVATVQTKDGVAEYTHTETYTAEAAPSKEYVYVLNWNALPRATQEAEKQKRYYSSEVNALSAWESDLRPRLQAALEARKSERHQWTVEEISAPAGHARHKEPQSQWEEAGTSELSFAFYDAPIYMTLRLQKKATKVCGAGVSLKGAVYGLYAAENILATDNRTVAFATGTKVTELCTDSQGKAESGMLLPGRYRLQEIGAPEGFCKDTKSYAVDLTCNDETVQTKQEITVYEEPIYGRIQIQKTFAGKDVPTQFVTKRQPKEDYVPGLCEHHTQHNAQCGYVEEQKAHACNHVHTADCYVKELVCEKEETEGHTHEAACYGEDGILQCGQEEEAPHVHAEDCYEQKEDCHHVHDADCQYAAYRPGQPCTWLCDICAFEEVLTEEELPITDIFELVDVQGKVVTQIKIAAEGAGKGTGISEKIPYGTYILRQTASTKQYAKVPNQIVKISARDQTVQLTLDDQRDETGFFLTKTRSISDTETGTMKKEPEEGAEFEIYAPDGRLIRRIRTDKNGIAYSGNLDSQGTGTYIVRQVRGADDYTLLPPQQIEVKQEKTIYYAEYDNAYCGSKIRIQKYKQKGKKEPEAEAEFTLLDAALIKDSYTELEERKTAEERTDYILTLKKRCPEAIIGVLTTGTDGKVAQILDNWIYATHPEGFIVWQTNGEEGYLLAEPVHSADLEQTTENGIHVFSFTVTDLWDDWANVTLQKQMTVSETDTVWESGALFRLLDAGGNTVAQETTDENGTVCFEKVDFGNYLVEQVTGDSRHTLCAPVFVTVTEENRHANVAVSPKPLVDKEKEIRFELSKSSAETGIPVSGARYQLYRMLSGEENGENKEEFVANMVTGTAKAEDTGEKLEGKAIQYLPYGQYVLREIYPADGYTLDERTYTFVLDKDSVTYTDTGEGSFVLEVTDAPVMGTIAIHKNGQVLLGYEKESQSFLSAKESLTGAVYGLYARDTVCKDDGTPVHEKDVLIDRKTTDESGYIRFTRKDPDGQLTDRFYLGKYYIKELQAPGGYVRDPQEKEIVLDWDTKTDQFDDLRKTEKTLETEPPVGNHTEASLTGKYILAEGTKVNQIIKDARTVTFTWEKAPAGVTTGNLDKDGGSSIVWWKDGEEYYISTQLAGQEISLHPTSAYMFASCGRLEKIRFKNVDTSKVTDMSYMFYRCRVLPELDLSSFDTRSTEDMRSMFAYCAALKTIYVNGQKLKRNPVYETDEPERIVAIPKREFVVGHSYRTGDFLYYIYGANGQAEEVEPEEADAKILPQTAENVGERTVQIAFDAAGQYGRFGTTEAAVIVREINGALEQTWKAPEITLELTDEQQKISLQLIKADAQDTEHLMLAGAEFTLYAACDIVNRRGKVILKKDDVIQTQVSGSDTFSYLEFINLPTTASKKDKSAPYMYYIRETKAPEGYEKTDRIVYCTGEAREDSVAEWIYGWSGYSAAEDDIGYSGSADWLYTNKKSTKVCLKKEWIADREENRPDTLQVSITLPDGNRKNYTLCKEDGWMLCTDIDAGVFAGYSSMQIRKWFTEQLPAELQKRYEETDSSWDPETGIYTFRNRSRLPVSATVTKRWEDQDDQEGLRPETIQVELYQNDTLLRQVTLPIEGKWTYTEENLPAADSEGHTYRYTWKETATELIGGDPAEGYLSTVHQEENSTDAEIINYHEVDTKKLSIQKHWDDSDDAQQIRPETVTVQLLANDRPVQLRPAEEGYVWAGKAEEGTTDRLVLSADVQWMASVDGLPVTDEAGDIVYRWQELMEEESFITGESTIGYAPSCSTDTNDPHRTQLVNTHRYTDGGSVLVRKRIPVKRFSVEVGDPVFIFRLEGTDVYGRIYTQKKELVFTEEDLDTADARGYITKSVLFEQVPYGTYTVTEAGMEGIYVPVQCIAGENAEIVETEDNCCKVQIGPSLAEAKEPDFTAKELYQADVTFENAAHLGSIRLRKYQENKKGILSGVTFVLKNQENGQTAQKTTDANGEVLFAELLPGSYTVTEVKTRDGYSLLKEPIEITLPRKLTKEEAKEMEADTKKAVWYADAWYFYDLTYEVTDEAVLQLPVTGGRGWPMWLGLVMGFGFITAGICRRKSHRHKLAVRPHLSENTEE